MPQILTEGSVVRVLSENINATYCVKAVNWDDKTAVYSLHWEGAENPDVEPRHFLIKDEDGPWFVEFGNMEEAEVTLL